MRKLMTGIAAIGLLSSGACAGSLFQDGPEDPERVIERFEALKKLAGEWNGPDLDGNGSPDASIVYRVTSAGSTVHATMSPGAEHEMVNTINVSRGEMFFTHYCALGNQPRMKLQPSDADNEWHFTFVGGTNIDAETDMYMGEVKIRVDGDHMTETWKTYDAGEVISTVEFEYHRAPAEPTDGTTYYLVLLEHGPNRTQDGDEAARIQTAHLEHLGRLAEQGSLMIAGPFADASGGVLVMKGASVEEVRALAERDPAVKAGRLVVNVRPWWIPSGAVAKWAESAESKASGDR
jgi:uncharacterized protein YciI